MTALLAFARLTRPLFLFGGFAGVALGAAVAAWSGHRIDAAAYLWVQALVTAFQLMVHYANDYFDRTSDVLAQRTAWSGGSGVLPSGALHPRVALIAALICAALGLAVSVRFWLGGNVAVAWIGIAICLLAWSYSAPPLRLAARGLGELDTALVVAVLVPAAGYAAFAGHLDSLLENALLAPAAAMIAMMLCVELPDAGADLAAGKRTMALRWGPARTLQMIGVVALVAATSAIGTALRLKLGLGVLALLPAAGAAFAVLRLIARDPRPASLAFWGIVLYATVTGGLAAAYGLAAAKL
jgi:1,4-dihydroxy-2-naphthoate octaprenyltransferase